MFGIDSSLTNKIGRVQKQYNNINELPIFIPPKLENDAFIKSQSSIIFEKSIEGKKVLQLIQNGNKSEIQLMNGLPIYKLVKDKDSFCEIIYSKDGEKLYEKTTYQNGESTKIIFADDGKTVDSIISFDKDGNVKSKKIINEKSVEITQEMKDSLPEYLYHFTSLENYNSILKDGALKATYSDRKLRDNGNKAVFLVDSDNLLNHWDSLKDGAISSYLVKLLKFCDKGEKSKIVMLKIPTSKLDIDNLTFRNQNIIMETLPIYNLGKKERAEYLACERLLKKIHPNSQKHFNKIVDDIFMKKRMDHLKNACPISSLQEHLSSPYEIVYQSNIPADAIQDAKIIDISSIFNEPYDDKETEEKAKRLVQDALMD